MTCYIELNEKSIGLAAAGAAMLGLSLSDGLLQPDGSLRARREARAAATAAPTRVADHAAATLAAVSAERPLGALPSHSQAAPEPAAPTETQPEDPAVEEEMLAYFDR